MLASCSGPRKKTIPIAKPRPYLTMSVPAKQTSEVNWKQLPGWYNDSLIGTLSALKQSCIKLNNQEKWQTICREIINVDELNSKASRDFFEKYFTPYPLLNADGTDIGLVTGYYEPLLYGSRKKSEKYAYPLYRWPNALARDTKLPARAALSQSQYLAGNELVYVDDPIDMFFLQVQGSGRIILDDGHIMRVGFSASNNQPYRSIGSWLIQQGELTAGQATMQGIKKWARLNPQKINTLFNINPRFVFFKELTSAGRIGDDQSKLDGPIGALGVPLTPERSIAVDPTAIDLGVPIFLSTTHPINNSQLNRLVFAQDTGSAIKGVVRADYFWGFGDAAGEVAGRTKQSGKMWVLVPK